MAKTMFGRYKGLAVFLILALVSTVVGVGAGVLTKTYLRTDKSVRADGEVTTHVGETFSFYDNLTETQKSLDWIKAKNYTVDVYGFNASKNAYEAIKGLAKVSDDNESMDITGIGLGKVRLTTFRDVYVEIPFRSAFYSPDTETLIESSGYSYLEDGFLLQDEIPLIKRFKIDSRFERIDFADYATFPNLRQVDVTSPLLLLPLSLEAMPSAVHLYVPTENYLAYLESPFWASRKDSLFALKEREDTVSVVLSKNGGKFPYYDDGKDILAIEIDKGSTLPFDTRYSVTRVGAEFVRWSDTLRGDTYDETTPITTDIHLAAEWDLIEYVIRFHYDNATAEKKEDVETLTVHWGDPIYALGKGDKTHGSFAMVGWSLDTVSAMPTYGLGELLPSSFLSATITEYDLYSFWAYERPDVVLVDPRGNQNLGPLPYNGSNLLHYQTVPVGHGRFAGYSFYPQATAVQIKDGERLSGVYVRSNEEDPTIYLYPVFAQEFFRIDYSVNLEVLAYDEGLSDYQEVTLAQVGDHGLTDASLHKAGHHFIGWHDLATDIYYLKEGAPIELEFSEVLVNPELKFAAFGGQGLTKVRLEAVFAPNFFDIHFQKGTSDPTETVYQTASGRYGESFVLSGETYRRGHTLSGLTSTSGYDALEELDVSEAKLSAKAVNALYEEIRLKDDVSDNAFAESQNRYTTLIPSWEKEVYTVTFDLNGHGADIGDIPEQYVAFQDHAVEPSSPKVGEVYRGWTFGGWKLEEQLFDFENMPVEGNMTLKAVWYGSYMAVEFHLGEDRYPKLNVDDAEDFATQQVYTDEYPVLEHEPTAKGYTFLGWYLDPACSEDKKVNPLEIPIIEPMQYYAKWQANVYQVTYNLNGHGVLGEGPIVKHIEYPGLVMPSVATKEDEPDWSFAGWYTSPDFAPSSHYDSAEPVSEELTLYAKWVQASYSFYIDNLYGESEGAYVVSGLHYRDPVPSVDIEPIKGHHMVRLIDLRTGETADPDATMPNGDLHYAVEWERDSYTVTVKLCDGREDQVYEVLYGDLLVIYNPGASGRSYEGWYLDDTYTKRWNPKTPIEGDMVLYAHWTVNVTLNPNFNETSSSPSVYTSDYGAAFSFPANPVEHGFTFSGWYLASGAAVSTGWKAYEHTTLYAHWAIAKFKVTFDVGEGSWLGANPSGAFAYRSSLSDPSTNAVNGSKTLEGWYKDGTRWNFGTDVVRGTMTLTANWTGGCVVDGTQVLMADGSTKAVEEIGYGDYVITFNHETGAYEPGMVLLNEVNSASDNEVTYLTFDNGSRIGVVGKHGFFDLDLSTYVYFSSKVGEEYIGHRFAGVDGPAALLSVETLIESTGYSSPVVAGTLNVVLEGMLSVADDLDLLVYLFEYGADLRFNAEALAKDVAAYGLADYADYEAYFPKDLWDLFHMEYLNVMVGKGLITFEGVMSLYQIYAELFAQRLG